MAEYVIRIEDGTSNSNAAPVASQSLPKEQVGPIKQPQKARAADYIASRAIMPMVKSVTTHVTSSVEISTGSRELQQKTDLAMSMVSTGMGAVSNVTGAVTAFGPAGIAIGLATTAISLLTEYGIKYSQTQQQISLEGEQLALYRSRFGLGFNQSRTGGTS